MSLQSPTTPPSTIKRELTAAIYRRQNLRARHLIHLLTVADPYAYTQLVQTLLTAPRVDALVILLNRIAVYLDSSETLTGVPMSPPDQSPGIVALSLPWLSVDLWHNMQHYHVAVLIKHFTLRDVILYRAMPGSPADIHDLRFINHEPIYAEIVKRCLLKPELLMIYYWSPQNSVPFHRILFDSDQGTIRYSSRSEVSRAEVESSLAFRLSDGPFKE